MNDYEKILQRAKEQNIRLINNDKQHIIIPVSENSLTLDGEKYFGRIFEDKSMVVVLHDIENEYSPTGFNAEPFIYQIIDKYNTYLSNGTVAYLVEFYIVEY